MLLIDLQNDYFPDGKFPLWNTDVHVASPLSYYRTVRYRFVTWYSTLELCTALKFDNGFIDFLFIDGCSYAYRLHTSSNFTCNRFRIGEGCDSDFPAHCRHCRFGVTRSGCPRLPIWCLVRIQFRSSHKLAVTFGWFRHFRRYIGWTDFQNHTLYVVRGIP